MTKGEYLTKLGMLEIEHAKAVSELRSTYILRNYIYDIGDRIQDKKGEILVVSRGWRMSLEEPSKFPIATYHGYAIDENDLVTKRTRSISEDNIIAQII